MTPYPNREPHELAGLHELASAIGVLYLFQEAGVPEPEFVSGVLAGLSPKLRERVVEGDVLDDDQVVELVGQMVAALVASLRLVRPLSGTVIWRLEGRPR